MRSGNGRLIGILAVSFFLWLGGKYLLPLCLPFLVGTGFALLAEPVVKLLCERLHLSRPVAAGIGVSAAFLGLTMLLLLLLAFVIRELGLLAGILPDMTQTARTGLSLLRNWMMTLAGKTPQSIRPLLQQNVSGLFSGGTALLDRLFSRLLGLAGAILSHVPDSALGFGTSVVSGFMISAKLPRIRNWIKSRLSRERIRPLLHTLHRVRCAVGGWFAAQLRLGGVTFLILLAGLLLLRISHGVLWAFAISLVDAFPVLGTGTVLLPWGLILYLQGDRVRAVGILGLYGIISLVRSVLEPRLVGKQLGLDPLITLFALYAGFKLWGFAGMILSPLLAVTVVQLLPENREK